MVECDHCDREMLEAAGCRDRQYVIKRQSHPVVTADPINDRCGDCGAKAGQPHHPGCDRERCPFCDGQLITCPHGNEAFASMVRTDIQGDGQ